MSELLADSAVQPVSIYAGAHYLTIVKDEHVEVAQCKLISGFIDEQKERSFQHLQVRPHGCSKLVSVINCHAPSSDRRKLTAARRSSYVKAFHKASGANPFIWGGDINTSPVQLTTLLNKVDQRYVINDAETSSAEQPGITQVVFSHPLRYTHGDIALTCGLRAAQVNSEVGRFNNGASADHDLVVAKVFVPASVARTTDARHSVMSSSQESSDSGSEKSSDSVSSPPQERRSLSRAAQPAPTRESRSSGRAGRLLASKAKQKARSTIGVDCDSSDPVRSPPQKRDPRAELHSLWF